MRDEPRLLRSAHPSASTSRRACDSRAPPRLYLSLSCTRTHGEGEEGGGACAFGLRTHVMMMFYIHKTLNLGLRWPPPSSSRVQLIISSWDALWRCYYLQSNSLEENYLIKRWDYCGNKMDILNIIYVFALQNSLHSLLKWSECFWAASSFCLHPFWPWLMTMWQYIYIHMYIWCIYIFIHKPSSWHKCIYCNCDFNLNSSDL